MCIYPNNLKAKPTMWLWQLCDVLVIGIMCLIAMFALVKLNVTFPLAITVVYTILTIRFEDVSIMDFINYACCFFILKPQYFEWREHRK